MEEGGPMLSGKVGIGGCQGCNKMVFERSDGTFGSIATVDAWGCKLEVNIVLLQELLEGVGTFIVESLELGFAAHCT